MMEKEYIGAINRLLPMLIIVKDNKFGKESIMLTIPSAAQSLFMSFSIAFTRATGHHNFDFFYDMLNAVRCSLYAIRDTLQSLP